jgi:hypothetical protein
MNLIGIASLEVVTVDGKNVLEITDSQGRVFHSPLVLIEKKG